MPVNSDEHYMRMTLAQARKGIGATSPNPRVGAVLVKKERVLAQGYHRAFGQPHAEVDCLSKVTAKQAAESTLYVNLEPCCHSGKKTPPCTDLLVSSRIRRVVYGMIDPNPFVNGQGLKKLREAGIEVSGPVFEDATRELNRGYLKFRSDGKPWVTLKMAQSLDGRIATSSGDARWISSPSSLKLAHRLRAEHDAVLIGIRTALADNPKLDVRHVRGPNPRRIVLDTDLRLPPGARLFEVDSNPVIIATRPYPSYEKADQLKRRGADFIWLPPAGDGTLDLDALLEELTQRGILYVLVEGGANVASSFIRCNLVDELVVVSAPLLIGGDGIPSIAPLGVESLAQSVKLTVHKRRAYGPDLATWMRPVFTNNQHRV
jgi:diaminohydroxyphosphoribosylaminopyrimidine deaminase/5-amino-6-(5-phosphoribosylamino)uracil reductase